jgi:hypothetical protein
MWVVHELIKKQAGTISVNSSTAPSHHGTVISLLPSTQFHTAGTLAAGPPLDLNREIK